jgi:DNA-binding response OmpR family regulator
MAVKKTILLVEDDVFVSDIYHTKLSQEGYDLMIAENGLEALKKIEDKEPDLILLDIVMPYMDGIEVLKKLKANDAWKNIPVIILTNLSQKEEVEEGLKMGANDYLIKSHFTPSEVVSKVKEIFQSLKK